MSIRMKTEFYWNHCQPFLSFLLSAFAVYCFSLSLPSVAKSPVDSVWWITIGSLTSTHVADTTVTCVGRDCVGHFIHHLFDGAQAAVRSFWRNHDLLSMLLLQHLSTHLLRIVQCHCILLVTTNSTSTTATWMQSLQTQMRIVQLTIWSVKSC